LEIAPAKPIQMDGKKHVLNRPLKGYKSQNIHKKRNLKSVLKSFFVKNLDERSERNG
jgi:hypothetical protein